MAHGRVAVAPEERAHLEAMAPGQAAPRHGGAARWKVDILARDHAPVVLHNQGDFRAIVATLADHGRGEKRRAPHEGEQQQERAGDQEQRQRDHDSRVAQRRPEALAGQRAGSRRSSGRCGSAWPGSPGSRGTGRFRD